MVLDFRTRLQDFTEVLMSDPHILMDKRLKFFKDFLIAMGVDETSFFLSTSEEQEELDSSELFDALEACSYGNFFLRQGKYTDAIDAFTNASQLANNVRYFEEAKMNAYTRMTSEYTPSSVEDISNIIDEITTDDNVSKVSLYTPGTSLFGDCKDVDEISNGGNVNHSRVYTSTNSLFDEHKENDEDLEADDFDDYPMEQHVHNQIYPVNTSNQYYQVTPSTVVNVSNPTYVKVNTDTVTRKRSNPSNRLPNAYQPQSPPPCPSSRATSTKPYFRQPIQSSTAVSSRNTRYNNINHNNRGFQNYTANAKQTQNFDLEKELKEIDEMNDAIDKLF